MASATKEKKSSKKDDGGEVGNKVTITDAGPCLKKISIEIPAETVTEQLGMSVDTLLSEAALPGFRKGHAPRRLVERKFGSTIRKEAKNQLVGQAFSKAVEDNKLRVVGDAASEMIDKLDVVEGKPLSFEVEVEVVPEFELPNLEGIEVRKPTFNVTEEMVQQELDRLALNEGKLEPKEVPGAGDYLTGHAVMKDAHGKVILDIHDAVVQIPTADKNGKGMILGVVVDDFGAQFGMPKPGEKGTVHTTGPENHEDERVRGHKLTITFDVKRADEIISATMDDVARRYGMENAEQVREAVKQRIDQRMQVEQQSAMRSQVAKHLMESVEIDLPQRLTASQAGRNLERARMELLYRGVDQQKIEEKIGDLRASSAANAARELKLFFVLDRAAEKMDVKVTDAELNGRIAQIAISRGERPEKLRQDLINRNQVGTVYQQVREHKTMDAILAKAKVSEMGVDEYNKLAAEMNESSKSKATSKKEHKDDADEKPKSKKK
jgi:trigger factor